MQTAISATEKEQARGRRTLHCEVHDSEFEQREEYRDCWQGECPTCVFDREQRWLIENGLNLRGDEYAARVQAITEARDPAVEKQIDAAMEAERETRRAEWRSEIAKAQVYRQMWAEERERARRIV